MVGLRGLKARCGGATCRVSVKLCGFLGLSLVDGWVVGVHPWDLDGKPCRKCGEGVYRWSNYCGAYVCTVCNDHYGLARCSCGWNLRPSERLEDEEEAVRGPYGAASIRTWRCGCAVARSPR